MASNLKQALAYLEYGWAVIPITTSGKRKAPLCEWHDYHHKLPTKAEVTKWWTQWPNAGIGVVTGKVSNLLVVDVDPDCKDPGALKKYAPTGLVSKTGRGGCHLFYEYPHQYTTVPNRVGIIPGVDIRCDGGYAILPPSRHENGNIYQWDMGDSPSTLPIDMVEDIVIPPKKQQEKADGDEKPAWISELLAKGLSEGGRNDACAKIAGYFAGKKIAKDITKELLEEWNKKNTPPLDYKELSTTIDSVYKTEWRKEQNNQGKDTTKGTTDKDTSPILQVKSLSDMSLKYGDVTLEWLIPEWINKATIAFMVAAPESYKTWTAFDIAVSIATGLPFFGKYPVEQTGPVLIFQQEDHFGSITDRLCFVLQQKMGLSRTMGPTMKEVAIDILPDVPIHVDESRSLRFDNERSMWELEQLIKDMRPLLVIIDPLYSTISNENYFNDAVEKMFILKHLRDRYGVTFLICHHTNKAANKKQKGDDAMDRHDMYGSQLMNGFMESGIQIRPGDDHTTKRIKRHFKAAENPKLIDVQFEIQTKQYPYKYQINEFEVQVDLEEGAEDIIQVLAADGIIEKIDSKFCKRIGLHKTAALRRMAKYIQDGLVIQNTNGSYQLVGVVV